MQPLHISAHQFKLSCYTIHIVKVQYVCVSQTQTSATWYILIDS